VRATEEQSAARQPRKRPYHHGDLRRALLDAALALVATEGTHAISLREVARRAEVSHTAPYRHFASREALLAAVAEEGFRQLRASMVEQVAQAGPDPTERLRASGVGYVLFAVTYPAHFRVMFGPELLDQSDYLSLAEAGTGAFQVLIDLIVEGQAAGQLRAGDPQPLALTCWSLTHGLSMLLIDRQLEHLGQGVDQASELARAIIGQAAEGLAAH
jgi:AcrR family transcriptional regulator